MFNSFFEGVSISKAIAASKHNEITTTGLGFGLITSSASEALLFTAVDNLERKYQKISQESAISNSVSSMDGDRADTLFSEVHKLYRKYSDDMKKIVGKLS